MFKIIYAYTPLILFFDTLYYIRIVYISLNCISERLFAEDLQRIGKHNNYPLSEKALQHLADPIPKRGSGENNVGTTMVPSRPYQSHKRVTKESYKYDILVLY